MGQPSFVIEFTRKAVTAISRSQQGIACLVLDDETLTGESITYTSFGDVKSTDLTATNYKLVQMAFLGKPAKVIVVKQQSDIADTVAILKRTRFNYLAMPAAAAADITAIKTLLESQRADLKGFGKAVFYEPATGSDSQRIIELSGCDNLSLNFTGTAETYTGAQYTCRLAGILAGLPDTVAATYTNLPEIVSCDVADDPDSEADNGRVCVLYEFGEYKLGRAVNSLKTLTDGITADFKKIRIVSTMDLIAEDIVTTFRNSYVGKYVNSYQNKLRFCGAVNSYLKALQPNLLDENMRNEVWVSYAKNKAYLEAQGIDTSNMSEQEIIQYNTGSYVGLDGAAAPTDVMEDLELDVNLFEEM